MNTNKFVWTNKLQVLFVVQRTGKSYYINILMNECPIKEHVIHTSHSGNVLILFEYKNS